MQDLNNPSAGLDNLATSYGSGSGFDTDFSTFASGPSNSTGSNFDLNSNFGNDSTNQDSQGFGVFGKGGYAQTAFSGLEALSGLYQAFSGFKQLGLAEDQFKFNKQVTTTNINNQANLVNAEMRGSVERANRNSSSGHSSGLSADEYIAKHGVGGI